MSNWLFWAFIFIASVSIVALPILTFPLHRRSRPAGDLLRLPRLRVPGSAIDRLEHECWPTQTAEWFGHDTTCRTYPCYTVTSTRAEVDYWLTGLGTREQINAAGYEAVPVTELGSHETRYVPGRRRELGGRPDWLPDDWTFERNAARPGHAPQNLPGHDPDQCWLCQNNFGRRVLPKPNLPDPGRRD
jgi:hypothetical protein